jgi:hypothetical protein
MKGTLTLALLALALGQERWRLEVNKHGFRIEDSADSRGTVVLCSELGCVDAGWTYPLCHLNHFHRRPIDAFRDPCDLTRDDIAEQAPPFGPPSSLAPILSWCPYRMRLPDAGTCDPDGGVVIANDDPRNKHPTMCGDRPCPH